METESIEMLQKILNQVMQMTDATQTFIWAVRRSLLLECAMVALVGVATAFNFWMLHRVLRVLREVIKLLRELAEEVYR